MNTILKNFLSALRRFKMATLLNILGLSIAFAAFMIIFMQLDYDWNFDKFHKNSDCIYRAEITFDGGAQAILSRPYAERFIHSSPHILAGALTSPGPGNTTKAVMIEENGVKNSYKEKTMVVYPEYTAVFAFNMFEGQDSAMHEPNTVLIPLSMARKWFGSQSAIGKQLKISYENYTIGGVYHDFPSNSVVENSIYCPMNPEENINSWGNSSYSLYIRVDAPENSEHLFENFKKNFDSSTVEANNQWIDELNLRLTPLADVHFTTDTTYDSTPKASKQTLLVLFAIAFIIIIIAGINFTNFSTALTPIRIKGINTQKILGASERTLRLSLLTEAVSISFISYLLSLVLVYLFSLSSLSASVNADLSLASHPVIAGATAFIALITGFLAGLYPTFYTTSFSPALVLKGSFGLSPKGRLLRNVLICIQFIASFSLIIGAIFMYLQNYYMQNTPLGYDKDEVIVTDINGAIQDKKEAFANQLKSFAAIEDVTYAETLLSSSDQYMGWGRSFRDGQIQYQCLPVDISFLKVMGVEIEEGRDFREGDDKNRHGVYVFNQKARNDYQLELGDRIDSAEIIGFMPDVKFASFRTEMTPMAFFVWGTQNWGRRPTYAYIKVKAGANLRAAMQYTRETLHDFDPEYPYDVRFFDIVMQQLYEKELKLSSLITLFSLIAVFISIVGVFGLVVFESEYRKKEIGIRKVLGSSTNEILILFNKIYFRISCVCFVIAVPIAYASIIKWLESFAYKTPLYWWVFLIAFVMITIITIITVTFQNWKTANLNPVESIKNDG
ncbi:MAG: ABC transporter permease [Tannerellaceae bacterium]|jgi:putative ABC transport system permease protein|nr:ABC transporter permease [Tannerellaceae bacterium]